MVQDTTRPNPFSLLVDSALINALQVQHYVWSFRLVRAAAAAFVHLDRSNLGHDLVPTVGAHTDSYILGAACLSGFQGSNQDFHLHLKEVFIVLTGSPPCIVTSVGHIPKVHLYKVMLHEGGQIARSMVGYIVESAHTSVSPHTAYVCPILIIVAEPESHVGH